MSLPKFDSIADSTNQSPDLWQLKLVTSQQNARDISNKLDDCALSVAWFDSNTGSDLWHCEALFDGKPDVTWLDDLLLGNSYTLMPLEQHDWITENQAAFPPLEIGRFYIHGSHIAPPQQTDKIIFEIDAATAFGTGEHATTQGCLLLLEHLYQNDLKFDNILDLGCGTGILGMAAAALFTNANITLADNDPEAIEVTANNLAKNQLDGKIDIILSEGFDNNRLAQQSPFDLIIANILAAPLIALISEMTHHCKVGGYLILSGLLATQINQVTKGYIDAGFIIQNQKFSGEWAALLLKRN